MGTTVYTIAHGEVLSEKRIGAIRDLVPDSLGSTIALLDSAQAKSDTFSYWPYGEEATRTGTTPTPFRFVGILGYYRDAASRSYVRARQLDTARGRWSNRDPLGFDAGDANLYRYVEGSPVTFSDPSGLLKIEVPPWIELPTYGNYCGAQFHPGHGAPINPLDACCKTHDDCFGGQCPGCTIFNQWNRPECKKCNGDLCDCAKGSCDSLRGLAKLLCYAALGIVLGYACNTRGKSTASSPYQTAFA
jgi:RHS repeat-associated protein